MSDINKLIEDLEHLNDPQSKLRSYKQTYNINNDSLEVTRWKFNEFNYYNTKKHKLPIRSRGLFILYDKETNENRICIRGYDKFFNIDEIKDTKIDDLKQNTKGPYCVTIKENGCILFVSGLKNGDLLISSKNNLYTEIDSQKQAHSKDHAKEGFLQIRKLFNNDEQRLKELGMTLYEKNYTAVFELCDDQFEEHVISYSNKNAGLYLHGLNLNEIVFKTMDMLHVKLFAERFGFKQINYFFKNTFEELQQFLNDATLSNTFDNREIEGFVIRCFKNDSNEDFFFKYKFEEPYLLYRQLREVTNDYINSKKRCYYFKKNQYLTNKYLDYVIDIIDNDEKVAHDFAVNRKGIIELRNEFFKKENLLDQNGLLDLEKLSALERENSQSNPELPIDANTKFIVVPISILGLGKTTFIETVVSLFPEDISMVSSDACHQRKNNLPILVDQAIDELSIKNKKICFIDRNNHMKDHRKQIFELVHELKLKKMSYTTNIQIIALPFVDQNNIGTIKQVALENILIRGDNHLTVKADKLGTKGVLSILNRFIRDFKLLNSDNQDEGFDFIIDSVLKQNSLTNKILDFFHQMDSKYGISNVLTENKFVDKAKLEEIEHSLKLKNKNTLDKRLPKIMYFGIEIPFDDKISTIIKQNSVIHNTDYGSIDLNKPEYHVTVAFNNPSDPNNHACFDHYLNQFGSQIKALPLGKLNKAVISSDLYEFECVRLVTDKKAVALEVKPKNSEVVIGNKYPHITIGVAPKVMPVYSNELIQKSYRESDDTLVYDLVDKKICLEGKLFAFLK